jgi:ClpP class serine protease
LGRGAAQAGGAEERIVSFFDLIWLFFIISSLQPWVRQRWLEAQRYRAFRRLEQKRHSRVIGLIHRQETMSFLGFPIARYIDIEDSEQLLRAIQLTDPSLPIDLILHTPGGLVLAAEQIAEGLRKRTAPVTVFVPHYAMSGGTLIALAADDIVMADNAVLGPVDPQLGESPAASILKVIEKKPIAEIKDKTVILADVAQKAINQVEDEVRRLLLDHMAPDRAESLARTLATGTWTHDYPIKVSEALELGLPVSTDMPVEVFELMQLYPQTSQRRPSVEYIPLPYGPADRKERQPATQERSG